MDFPRLDKSVLEVTSIDDDAADVAYWHSRTPHERLLGLEMLRRFNYGEAATSARLQRLLEITERE